MKNEFFVPDPAFLAKQSDDNKQGRENEPMDGASAAKILEQMQSTQETIYKGYQELLDTGLARELARINLPLSMYTEFYWQIDLHNLFHFLRLRMDSHAQKEIRDYAEVLYSLTEKVCPMACEAFHDYKLGAVLLSSGEADVVKAMLAGKENTLSGRDLELFNEKFNLD